MKPTAQFKRNDNPSDTHEKDKNAQIEIQGLKVDMRDTSGIMSERINLYPKYPQSTTSSAVLAPKERSSGFVIFLMIVVCIGNYFFGYQVAIFNVVSEPLLEGILGKTADEAKSFSSLSGFLFSVGCLVGSVLLGPLTKYVGMVRLTYIMEFFNIATLLLLTMKNLTLIMILRFVAGFLGGLSISLLPLICNSLFPGSKAAIGGGGTYLTLVVFILVASLQNIIFGGIEGLKNNLWLVYVWPIAIAVIRIILMTIFLIRVETPKYLTEFFNGSEEERKSKLLQSFKLVYEESSAKEITEKTLAGLKNSTGGNSSSSQHTGIFSPKYKKRTWLGIFLSLFQQLGGINIMVFFSTKIFDDISGNGSTITLILSLGNVLGAIISLFIASLPRLKVFKTALVVHAIGIIGTSVGIWINNGTFAAILACIYMTSFGVGNGSVLFIYSGEILPPAAMGLAFGSQWLISALVGIGAQPIADAISTAWLFIILGAFIMIDLVVLSIYGEETLGKTPSEIDEAFAPTSINQPKPQSITR